MSMTPLQNHMAPRFGKLTEAQRETAERLWKPLAALPPRRDYDQEAATMLYIWDLYAANAPELAEAFPDGKAPEQVREFEKIELDFLARCVQAPDINRLQLLQRIRATLEAMHDAEHYTPSGDLWQQFVGLTEHQLKRSYRAILQLNKND